MKYFIKTFMVYILISGISFSCSDYLNVDSYFSDELKLDSIFSQTRYIEAYMWGAAAMFSDEGELVRQPYTPGPMATDEAFTLHATGSEYAGMSFVLGEINSSDLKSLNTWNNLYKIIRKCNTVISRMDEAKDMTSAERLNIEAHTRFIRAYAYYNLLIDYGPPILLGDEIVETNESIEYYDRSRSTFDEAVEYICTEFEAAARYMPATVSIMNFGRPTKGAAYGLVARLRLMHASPLFNGGQTARIYFGNWTRKLDGAHYVSQQYYPERWAVAAFAAKRVMDLTNAGVPLYGLYTVNADFNTPDYDSDSNNGITLPQGVTSDPNYYQPYPNGAAGIDHYRSYSEIFNGEAVMTVNPEFVWARKSEAIKNDTRRSFPVYRGGYNGQSVTQKIVDAYYMVDGRDIKNPSADYPYSETGFIGGASLKDFSGYKFTRENEVSNMYINREARFYASIGFSECFWECLSASSTAGANNFTVRYYYDASGGKSGASNPVDYPPTGYVLRKTVHPQDSWENLSTARRTDKAYSIIRYAEILLSYAEAINNIEGSHTVEIDGETQTFSRNIEEIKRGFNPVRYRAGLPGLSDAELANPGKVQELIVRERMIEFLYENRRYYDVRRWGIYENVEREPIMGMNTDAPKEGFYQRVVPNTSRIGRRIVDRKLVFVPIPRDELKRMPLLDQNPGW
jgi:hypothetical protein